MNSDEYELRETIERKVHEHIIKIEKGDNDSRKHLEQLALEEFELQKEELVEEYPEHRDEIDEITDIYDLEFTKGRLQGLTEKRKSPTGKVKMKHIRSNQENQEFETSETTQDVIDKIYDQWELQRWFQIKNDNRFNAELFNELSQKRDRLLQSVILGEQNRGITRNWTVWTCPSCQKTVSNSNACLNCGYKFRGYNERQQAGDVIIR